MILNVTRWPGIVRRGAHTYSSEATEGRKFLKGHFLYESK
jgi:hypothetical protein